jgi:phage terminase large subunit
VVGGGFYAGDIFLHPNAETVRAAIDAFQPEAPVAYGIDFGVTNDGRTLLVEVNDAFALGCYGLSAVEYAEMLEDRWLEVVSEKAVTT